MDDEISGGNGFQEYLMTYGGEDEKRGRRIRGKMMDQIEVQYLERV